MTNPIPNPHSPTPGSRTRANRANARHSTGPRTQSGKQRSSQNALRHGLTARAALLPTEDPDAYQRHVEQFLDEYAPATPTETQLVHEIANTAWRLNRIPLLEAELLAQSPNPQSLITHLATLGLYGSRLSRQFQKALDQLLDIQEAQRVRRAPPNKAGTCPRRTPFCAINSEDERRRLERRQLNEAADLFIRHQRKGLPWDPAELFSEQAGFVFSKQQVERRARELTLQNPAYYTFHPPSQADPPPAEATVRPVGSLCPVRYV